jgi:hypothetical protein
MLRNTPMTRFILAAFVLLILSLAAAPRTAQAAQSYDNCTGFITSIPAVISTQGTWCFKADLTTAITSGNAIIINTNNVTIDCNDFKLGGLSAGLATNAIGITAVNRLNLTVRHCNIRGFLGGLYFSGSAGGGHLIEDNRFDGNTYTGFQVEGDGSLVQRNRVFDTGGTTLPLPGAYGMFTQFSVDIRDNTVSGVFASAGGGGSATGIRTESNVGGRITGNGVRGLAADGAGISIAIYNGTSDRVTLDDNQVLGDASPGSIGLRCGSSNSRAKDNVIGAFATAIDTCGNAGGNDNTP